MLLTTPSYVHATASCPLLQRSAEGAGDAGDDARRQLQSHAPDDHSLGNYSLGNHSLESHSLGNHGGMGCTGFAAGYLVLRLVSGST